ncbi:metalloregulator ArsR/SmtB family transcription factor [bacterium]|nr:metalloregulator ArsR/SmtB family transcription factor [bacterium]
MNNPSTQDGDFLDTVLTALANPLRRSLVERLTERDITVGELSEGAGVSMPSISRHLRVLEKAELIVRIKRGRNHLISLQQEPLEQVVHWLSKLGKRVPLPVDTRTVFMFGSEVESDSGLAHPVPQLQREPEPVADNEPVSEPDPLDLSPDSLSDLVKRLKNQ